MKNNLVWKKEAEPWRGTETERIASQTMKNKS